MVDGEPYLALGVEDAAEVGPGHCEVGPGLDRFQVARLVGEKEQGSRKEKGREQ